MIAQQDIAIGFDQGKENFHQESLGVLSLPSSSAWDSFPSLITSLDNESMPLNVFISLLFSDLLTIVSICLSIVSKVVLLVFDFFFIDSIDTIINKLATEIPINDKNIKSKFLLIKLKYTFIENLGYKAK